MDTRKVETEYPEYAGDDWTHRQLPEPDRSIVRILEAMDTVNGYPRFRVVDGTTAMEVLEADDILDKTSKVLKYPYCTNKMSTDGWRYFQNGQDHAIANVNDAPDGVVVFPNTSYRDFGVPRYVVEVYRSTSEPNIKENGYTYGWTVQEMEFKDGREISHFRPLSGKDIQLAEKCLALIQRMSKSEIRQKAKEQTENICQVLNDKLPNLTTQTAT